MVRLTERETQELQQQFPVSIDVSVDGKTLVVRSELQNHSALRAHVFNVLWDFAPNGSTIAAPAAAYVCLDGEELRLGHMPYPSPNHPVLVRIVPHLTPLAAGRALREDMRFDVPIEEYSPYQRAEPTTQTESARASRILLIYGVIVAAPDDAFVKSAVTGGFQLIDGRLSERIFEVRSEPVSIDVAVNCRTGYFERF